VLVRVWTGFNCALQHWIRLEIYPDIVVKSLKIGVDPADNSYMPSVIVVNGGTTLNSLKELNYVNVKNHDTSVLLLYNLDKVVRLCDVGKSVYFRFCLTVLPHH
jgi:E3 ubiquitin-protein ligase HERC2